MKKKSEYEIAVDYYKNDVADDFTIEEAIRLFEIAALNQYTKAYYDLYNIYIDNYDENDIEANENALKYLQKALNKGEGNNEELVELKLRLADSYKNNRKVIAAIELYLKLEGKKPVESKIINCLDDLNRKSEKMSPEDKERVINCVSKCKLAEDKRIKKKSFEIINNILTTCLKNISSYKTENDFNKLKNLLDRCSNYTSNSIKICLYDDYYAMYGKYLINHITNIDDAKKALEIYERISISNDSKINGKQKINHWIGMHVIKNSSSLDELSEVLDLLKNTNLTNYSDSDLKEIENLINELIDNEKYTLANKYADLFCKITNNNYIVFTNLSKTVKDKRKFKSELKKALDENNYESQLYVASEYENGVIIEKDINRALEFYLKAYNNYVDEKSFSFLKEYYGGYTSLLDELKRHFNSSFNIQVETAIKNEKFYDFDNYLNKSTDAIRIDKNIYTKNLSYIYPSDRREKCKLCDSSKAFCRKWYEYYSKCSNEVYDELYLDYYMEVNDNFFDKISSDYSSFLKQKKEITIVLVGCGNLYELKSLHRWYGVKLNVIILDQFLWQKNQLDCLDISDFNNIWFKKCNFYEELKKDIYSKTDIIYYSRCIIPYDFNFNIRNAIPAINSIIRANQITIFSEVLNVNLNKNGENNAVQFENDFKEYMYFNFICTKSYAVDYDKYHSLNVYFNKMLSKSAINYDTNVQKSLQYFLFYIEGRK